MNRQNPTLFLAVLILSASCLSHENVSAQAKSQPCVVLKRSSGSDHIWSGIEFYYVSGEYPNGYKFRTNLRGRNVRDLVKKGGRFVIVEPNYSAMQLEEAERTCKASDKVPDK